MSRQALGFLPGRGGFQWSPPGVPSRYVSVRVVSLVTFLGITVLILCTLVARSSTPRAVLGYSPSPPGTDDGEPTFIIPGSRNSTTTLELPDVAALLAAIRNATARASGGRDVTFTREAEQEWKQQHPCRARDELQPLYALRRIVADVAPNKQWQMVFAEYATLHRVCMESVGGDVVEYFANRGNNDSSSASCRFLVAGIAPGAGLGNKMLSMVSSLLYAILTQRVFLIAADTLVPGIMCEPFPGSSWLFDPEWKVTPEYAKPQYWTSKDEFYKQVDDAIKSQTDRNSHIYGLVANDEWCQPGQRFFCDTEQFYYHRVPWVYINGCFYFLPKLFAIPSFQPVLLELFPDKMALTHLLRSAMLPADDVWRRIDQIYSLYFRNADRRVGFQVRYRDGEADFNATHQLIIDRVHKCALDNNIIPEAGAKGALTANGTANSRYQTSVFIASLYPALHDFLGERYIRNPPEMEDVAIVQVTRGREQHFNDEEDKQALTEVIALSLADYLFVTPLSTFGGLAQGYGALLPWFIDNRPTSELACVRAQTVDTCYQLPQFTYHCPYDPALDKQWVIAQVSFLKDCLPVDAKYGMQLITT